MYAIVRESFGGTPKSRSELVKLMHGPELKLVGDEESPALSFEKLLNAKAWVAMMTSCFPGTQSFLIGAEEDPLVQEFNNFRVPAPLFTLICAVCDGRCVYNEEEDCWQTKNLEIAKARQIFATIDQLEE